MARRSAEKELQRVEYDRLYKQEIRKLDLPEERHRTVWAHCDGSCHNATGNRGGYGVTLRFLNHRKEMAGGAFHGTTSSRMEMLAACKAMESVKPHYRLVVSSDSQYVVNCFNKNWLVSWEKFHYVSRANVDLLKRLKQAYDRFPKGQCIFVWGKGHNGNPDNERVDRLAGEAGARENPEKDKKNGFQGH